MGCSVAWRASTGALAAALAGHWAGYSGEILGGWGDPLASYSAILSMMLGGMRCQAALVGYLAGSTDELLPGYSAGSTDELLWDIHRDTRRDVLAACSGGILGGSTGELLWDTQRDTRRDLLAGCSGGSLAEYLAESTGELL